MPNDHLTPSDRIAAYLSVALAPYRPAYNPSSGAITLLGGSPPIHIVLSPRAALRLRNRFSVTLRKPNQLLLSWHNGHSCMIAGANRLPDLVRYYQQLYPLRGTK